jgi:hypothetical protein
MKEINLDEKKEKFSWWQSVYLANLHKRSGLLVRDVRSFFVLHGPANASESVGVSFSDFFLNNPKDIVAFFYFILKPCRSPFTFSFSADFCLDFSLFFFLNFVHNQSNGTSFFLLII